MLSGTMLHDGGAGDLRHGVSSSGRAASVLVGANRCWSALAGAGQGRTQLSSSPYSDCLRFHTA